MMWTSIKNG